MSGRFKTSTCFKKNIITQTDGLLNELLTDLNPNKTYSLISLNNPDVK